MVSSLVDDVGGLVFEILWPLKINLIRYLSIGNGSMNIYLVTLTVPFVIKANKYISSFLDIYVPIFQYIDIILSRTLTHNLQNKDI